MNFRHFLVLLVVVVLAAGCSREVEGTATSNNHKESSIYPSAYSEEVPPELHLTIGGEDIKTY